MVLPHSCDLDKPEVTYVAVATAWRASNLSDLGLDSKDDVPNVLANRTLDKFSLPDVPQIGEALVVDLRHVVTWPKEVINGWTKVASLTTLETDALQWALIRFYSLRDITRQKRLAEFDGKTIRRITTVAESKEQARVTIAVEGTEETLNLWLSPRK